MKQVTDDMRDEDTPSSVEIRAEARAPVTDPTLGLLVSVTPPRERRRAKHRLVTMGDSITQGFQSGAIFATEISYPRIVAHEMGWEPSFRYPRYGGPGGLPFNIEYVVRRLERAFGDKIDWTETVAAAIALQSCMDDIEDYWERGAGSAPPALSEVPHNLAIYGWDLRDALSRTAGVCARAIAPPQDNWFQQIVENANDRAALHVLRRGAGGPNDGDTMVSAAEALGNDGGIETLVVFLGANNALGSITKLSVTWSDGGASGKDYQDLDKKKAFNVWDPEHFAEELAALVTRVKGIDAEHVIWATIPHVTIAPAARGVCGKVSPGSRYFRFYTRPWISDQAFSTEDDRYLTANQARAIDSAIDQYNDAIVRQVAAARLEEGRDWLVLDVAGIMDRLASRRYIQDSRARPNWWTPYPLPAALAALSPVPDSRFFSSARGNRLAGGLFSLDGIHPTTIGYGILADELMKVMQVARVPFFLGDGETRREAPVSVDFERLLILDTLISNPPPSFTADLKLISWVDQKIDLFKLLFR